MLVVLTSHPSLDNKSRYRTVAFVLWIFRLLSGNSCTYICIALYFIHIPELATVTSSTNAA